MRVVVIAEIARTISGGDYAIDVKRETRTATFDSSEPISNITHWVNSLAWEYTTVQVKLSLDGKAWSEELLRHPE